MSNLRPRRCLVEKGPDGYGFHLHGEKGKSGQFIRLVEPGTPAEEAGLKAGDRLVFVNGDNVEVESHSQVVARIRASSGGLELIVVDQETLELLRRHGLSCKEEYVTEGIPVPGDSAPEERPEEDSPAASSHSSRRGSEAGSLQNGRRASAGSKVSAGSNVSAGSKEESSGPRPRLCVLKKGPGGYGFNLHSEKSRPGQFIRAVDEHSAAERAGLRPNDKIIQVNGMSMVGKQHTDVVGAIKASGEEVSMLVVDPETEHFFSQCGVLPSEEHLTGPLPEPRVDRASVEEQQEAAEEAKTRTSLSSDHSASSHTSQPSPSAMATEEPGSDSLGLGLSVAQARERAKRASKNAPRMDWNQRKEVFSNL